MIIFKNRAYTMRSLIFFITLILLFPITVIPAHSQPSAAEYGTVLNLSGRQRMLTQKMTKEILLVAYGYEIEQNLKTLAITSALFDKTLKGLLDGSADLGLPPTESPRIRRQLGKVKTSWNIYHSQIKKILDSGSVSSDVLTQAAKLNLPLLKQMNKAVVLYERDASRGQLKSNPTLATAINLSGKQRMLTQKMSKEYLLVALEHEVGDNKLNLLETLTLFDRTLKGLKVGDESLGLTQTKSEKIIAQLDKVSTLWKDFMPVVESASSVSAVTIDESDVAKVAKNNLPLLKAMNSAVKMYEKSAG